MRALGITARRPVFALLSARSSGAGSHPKTLRPAKECESRRSSAMISGTEGPSAAAFDPPGLVVEPPDRREHFVASKLRFLQCVL